MSNRSDRQIEALLHAAREPRDTARVQFGFETRLMARLREESATSVFTWAWKLAPFFATLAIAAGIWSRTPATRVAAHAHLFAEAASDRAERFLVFYMTGEER